MIIYLLDAYGEMYIILWREIIITAPNFFDGFSSRDVSIIITTPTVTMIVIGALTLIIISLIIKCKRQSQILGEDNNDIDDGSRNDYNDSINEAIASELEGSVLYSNPTTAD